MSFIDNTEEVLKYTIEIQRLIKRRKNFITDFSNITNLSNDAIALIMSVIQTDPDSKKCHIFGNYPRDPILKNILVESGLFSNTGNEQAQRNYILTRKNKKADGKVADEIIKRASKVVFGSAGHCQGVYRALMESMANTCYHAKPGKKAFETWCLTVYHNKKEKFVSFAFIDLGVGIFESRKMTLFAEKFNSFFGLNDNISLLKEILSGNKQSSTKIPYRGKGLPAIYKGLARNYYSSLKIISNDVKADLENNNFELLGTKFSGTFLYWELKSHNRWTQLRSK